MFTAIGTAQGFTEVGRHRLEDMVLGMDTGWIQSRQAASSLVWDEGVIGLSLRLLPTSPVTENGQSGELGPQRRRECRPYFQEGPYVHDAA